MYNNTCHGKSDWSYHSRYGNSQVLGYINVHDSAPLTSPDYLDFFLSLMDGVSAPLLPFAFGVTSCSCTPRGRDDTATSRLNGFVGCTSCGGFDGDEGGR